MHKRTILFSTILGQACDVPGLALDPKVYAFSVQIPWIPM
jgi:hypothetical protein